jgi:ubiquinone/menaquinone biosynthesis C-methylase UbiE
MTYGQKKMWEEIFKKKPWRLKTSAFAKECLKYFPEKAKILELGCGLGRDTIFFSKKGYRVTAIDFSKQAIKKAKENAERLGAKDIKFLNQDISKKLKFKDGSFDVVYARLTLHYFTDKVTEKIFQEIKRVLKPKGILCACCKSIKDPLYGKGKMIEKDMYILDGHIRHFFSEKYLGKN